MQTLIIFTAAFLLVDLYVFKGITSIYGSTASGKLWITIIYWVVSVTCLGLLLYGIINRGSFRNANVLTLIIGIWLSFFIPKVIFTLFHALDDLTNLVYWGVSRVTAIDYSRRFFITQLGGLAGGLMFGGMLYGIFWGKFNFRIRREDLVSPKIPPSMDGLRIVQISDAHLGSFGDRLEPVEKAVRLINDTDPDYVVFTGDMVNNHAREAEPWIELFKKIGARYGKYSVFGNHDYADYGNFSAEEKADSVKRLKEIHGEMGFTLLEDEHVALNHGGAAISLIGVHNWGHGFHQVGNLSKAMSRVPKDHFKILLSHDPTHFDHQVKVHTDIDLTLSGHTHGMQMGIEIPGLNIKWSPVKFRYAKWAGMYRENGQALYVNRGLGVLAYPGRIGMDPEITLITLKSRS